MRVVVQRVSEASVKVDGQVVGAISTGIMALVGLHETDDIASMTYVLDKLIGLRIFEDECGKMNLSTADISGGILLVPNFTIYGDCRKGKRPSFIKAAKPEQARELFAKLVELAKEKYETVETGIFQADMKVSLLNDGPVTVIIDSDKVV